MDSAPDHPRLTRIALGILTDVWSNPASKDLEELFRIIEGDEVCDPDLVIGLLNVATILLAKMDRAGIDVDEVLADIGLRYGAR